MRTKYILTTCILVLSTLALIACQQTKPTTSQDVLVSVEDKSSPCYPNTSCSDVSNTVIIPIVVEKGTPVHQVSSSDRNSVRQKKFNTPCQKQKMPYVSEKRTSADLVNIETPMRCRIPAPTSHIISDIPLTENDFKLVRLEKDDPLPRYEVNGYTFNNQPLDLALQTLVSEAGIKVYSDDGLFPDMSAEDIRGELSAVVQELADSGDAYVRYDSTKKRLYLSRWARFTLKVPAGYVGMYAVLDALRGANITDVQPDWNKNELYFRVTKTQEATIQRLINYLKEDLLNNL